MTPFVHLVANRIIPAAYDLLPSRCASTAATRMLLAIGWQESRFLHRAQITRSGVPGPARGFWQFEERGGIFGVLRTCPTLIRPALEHLRYPTVTPREAWELVEHNDVAAALFARLLLWTLPDELPKTAEEGWRQYLAAWRPGKPHPETWDEAWEVGREAIC